MNRKAIFDFPAEDRIILRDGERNRLPSDHSFYFRLGHDKMSVFLTVGDFGDDVDYALSNSEHFDKEDLDTLISALETIRDHLK